MKSSSRRHAEHHHVNRIGWLRAAVLGANDGIVSTASLVVGIAAAGASRGSILLASISGLVAGAMSMAAGEYVSVKSQADAETADIARERGELVSDPPAELRELTGIYVKRELEPGLARQVAEQLTAHGALVAHVRDELGISEVSRPRPVQAALASAASFAVGAILPVIVISVAPGRHLVASVFASSLVFLALLGFVAALAGAADAVLSVWRVTFWGALAMATTAGVGLLFPMLG
jgi:VIT1/CCC1 family predicted Fe2+/Mn2+ transporter